MTEEFVVDLAQDPVVLSEVPDPIVISGEQIDTLLPDQPDVVLEEVEDVTTLVEEPDLIVLQEGVVGLTGPQGPAGKDGEDGDRTHVHSQVTASESWVIDHGMGKRPSVSIVDSAGTEIYAPVTWVNNDRVIINFSSPLSGYAYLN